MLDIKYLVDNLESSISRLNQRNGDYSYIRDIVADYKKKNELQASLEQLKFQKNNLSKQIGDLKRNGEDASEVLNKVEEIKNSIANDEVAVNELDQSIKERMELIPNIPNPKIPVGKDETSNKVVKVWGTPRVFDFPVKDHIQLSSLNNILDFERAAKVSGSRFVFDIGLGARLERGLISFMMDLHSIKHKYTEVIAPYLVNYASMYGTGQFPKFKDEAFAIKDWDLYLNPTAEVPTINMYRDEILSGSSLPLSFCCYTTAFRSEAGAAGKDTKGILRQHQFHKVELIKFAKPSDSYKQLEIMLKHSEKVLQLLEIPYRVVELCSGDIGFGAAKTYDIEVWLPGQNTYREIASISNDEDFQARRAGIRYKDATDSKTSYVHTLNGSGLAVGRTMIAVIENYQNADGSITIPKALVKYLKINTITPDTHH